METIAPRGTKRCLLSLETCLRYRGLREAAIRLSDLSFGGFAGECAVSLEKGEYVSLALPQIGLVRARVVWQSRGRMGARFNKPVDVRKCFAPPRSGMPSQPFLTPNPQGKTDRRVEWD